MGNPSSSSQVGQSYCGANIGSDDGSDVTDGGDDSNYASGA